MNLKKFKGRSIHLGPIQIKFNKSGRLMLVFLPMEEGGWADHMTLALPKGDDEAQHDFSPHLTRRWKGGAKKAQPLAEGSFGLRDLDRFIREFKQNMLRHWLAYTRPADLTLLAIAGYEVVAMQPDDPRMVGMCHGLFRCFTPRGGVKHLGLPDLEHDMMTMVRASTEVMVDSLRSPLALDDFKENRQPMPVLRFSEDPQEPVEQLGTLLYFPKGLPTGDGEPGWYLTQANWMCPETLTKWLPGLAEGRLMELMETILEAFGHEGAESERT